MAEVYHPETCRTRTPVTTDYPYGELTGERLLFLSR
jgi:hypothetical protein